MGGQNPGSIRIDGERVPIDVPRVRDAEAGEERAEEGLKEFENRSLAKENFLALGIDANPESFRNGEQTFACMGVTEAGYEKILGFTQATTEDARPIKERLRDLIERG